MATYTSPDMTWRPPLSRHRAFVPLLSLWLAALLGGAIAVLPPGMAVRLAESAGLGLPPGFPGNLPFAGLLALGGALVGGGAAWALARAQAARARPQTRQDEQVLDEEDLEEKEPQIDFARPMFGEEEQVIEHVAEDQPETTQPAEPDVLDEPEEPDRSPLSLDELFAEDADATPVHTPSHHGKAVELLREKETGELGMVHLVERFAVALDDHRRLVADDPVGLVRRSPPVNMVFELNDLKYRTAHKPGPTE